MRDDEINPYRAPTHAVQASPGSKQRPFGPIVIGVIAIGLATLLAGGTGLLGGVLGVVPWWFYKFWPRPAAPENPEAAAYLRTLEEGKPPAVVVSDEQAGDSTGESGGEISGGVWR